MPTLKTDSPGFRLRYLRQLLCNALPTLPLDFVKASTLHVALNTYDWSLSFHHQLHALLKHALKLFPSLPLLPAM